MTKETQQLYNESEYNLKRKAIVKSRENSLQSVVSANTATLHKDQRNSIYINLKKKREKSVSGLIGSLIRYKHLQARHINEDGTIDIEALSKQEVFIRNPNWLKALEGHKLSDKSKTRQEAKRIINYRSLTRHEPPKTASNDNDDLINLPSLIVVNTDTRVIRKPTSSKIISALTSVGILLGAFHPAQSTARETSQVYTQAHPTWSASPVEIIDPKISNQDSENIEVVAVKGHTLSGYSERYCVTVKEIIKANKGKIKKANKIFAGEVYKIPAGSGCANNLSGSQAEAPVARGNTEAPSVQEKPVKLKSGSSLPSAETAQQEGTNNNHVGARAISVLGERGLKDPEESKSDWLNRVNLEANKKGEDLYKEPEIHPVAEADPASPPFYVSGPPIQGNISTGNAPAQSDVYVGGSLVFKNPSLNRNPPILTVVNKDGPVAMNVSTGEAMETPLSSGELEKLQEQVKDCSYGYKCAAVIFQKGENSAYSYIIAPNES